MALLYFGCHELGCFEHREPGAHCALGVVFVCALGTEDGEHAVAGVLQHAPLMRLDGRGEAFERTVHDHVDVFRVEPLAQAG